MISKTMAASRKKATTKKPGRPATGHDPFIGFRFPVEKIAAIDAWAAEQPDRPTRAEALRRLVDLGMKAAMPRVRGRLSR
jgi:hypothetical protein